MQNSLTIPWPWKKNLVFLDFSQNNDNLAWSLKDWESSDLGTAVTILFSEVLKAA